jgi:hypothetical protein
MLTQCLVAIGSQMVNRTVHRLNSLFFTDSTKCLSVKWLLAKRRRTKMTSTSVTMTLSIMTFSIMAFRIMTLSKKGLYVTLNINATERNNSLHSDECRYAERRVFLLLC